MIRRLLSKNTIKRIIGPIMPAGAWYLRVSPRMITCQQFNEFIFEYTEGNLSNKQLTLFERHMRICPMCRNFLRTYVASYKAGEIVTPYSDHENAATVPQELIDAISDISNDSETPSDSKFSINSESSGINQTNKD